MKSIKQTICGLALMALAATAWHDDAAAAPVVSVNPTSQDIIVGGVAAVDIVVSGLTEAVGGFSFTLSFNDGIVEGLSFTNDPGLTMGLDPLDLSFGFGAGGSSPLDIFFVADFLEDEASLAAAQGASFVLTTITFEGLVNGLSPLTLSDVVLSNWDGTETLALAGVRNGSICVGGNCVTTIPEPATYALVALALAGMGALRRRAA